MGRILGGYLWANRREPREAAKVAAALLLGLGFAREAAADPPDRVHAHWATYPAAIAALTGALLDVPFSFTAHAHDIYGHDAHVGLLLDQCDFAVTISAYNADLLRRRHGPAADVVRVLHCGVDTAAFAPVDRTGRTEPFSLLCVGSLRDYKGHAVLLDALALVPDVRCRLVGDGPLRGELDEQVERLGLGDRVELLGARDAAEVRALLAAADAFVLPSVVRPRGAMEGIPVALMEAMAAGLPVVTTRISGIPELVVDGVGGLLVEPDDPAALAGAIRRLAGDPALRAQLGAGGRAQVLAAFDQAAQHSTLERWLAG